MGNPLDSFKSGKNLKENITSWNIHILIKASLSGDIDFSKKLADYCRDKKKQMGEVIYNAYLRGLRNHDIDLQKEIKEAPLEIKEANLYETIQTFLGLMERKKGITNRSELIKKEMEKTWARERYY